MLKCKPDHKARKNKNKYSTQNITFNGIKQKIAHFHQI